MVHFCCSLHVLFNGESMHNNNEDDIIIMSIKTWYDHPKTGGIQVMLGYAYYMAIEECLMKLYYYTN